MYVVPSVFLDFINDMSMVVEAAGKGGGVGDSNVHTLVYIVYCLRAFFFALHA